jgi:hypothetical protein
MPLNYKTQQVNVVEGNKTLCPEIRIKQIHKLYVHKAKLMLHLVAYKAIFPFGVNSHTNLPYIK